MLKFEEIENGVLIVKTKTGDVYKIGDNKIAVINGNKLVAVKELDDKGKYTMGNQYNECQTKPEWIDYFNKNQYLLNERVHEVAYGEFKKMFGIAKIEESYNADAKTIIIRVPKQNGGLK